MNRFLIIAALLIPVHTIAQDAETEIVNKFCYNMQNAKGVTASFTFTLENIQEKISSSYQGKLLFSDNRYILELMDMETYFDGTTKWQYIKKANEVTISTPMQTNEDGFLENPTALFKDYDKNFKTKFRREFSENKRTICEFDFYPRNLNLPYSLLRLQVEKETLNPVSFKYQGKDGNSYIITLKSFKTNQQHKTEMFTFDVKKYKNIEVVDLRE